MRSKAGVTFVRSRCNRIVCNCPTRVTRLRLPRKSVEKKLERFAPSLSKHSFPIFLSRCSRLANTLVPAISLPPQFRKLRHFSPFTVAKVLLWWIDRETDASRKPHYRTCCVDSCNINRLPASTFRVNMCAVWSRFVSFVF